MHHQADLAVNVAVIVALLLEMLGLVRGADALFGLGIAAYLGVSRARARARRRSIYADGQGMAEEPSGRRCLNARPSHPLVRGVHELRTRGTGLHHFAQFHIWVDPEMTVGAAHEVVDAVEARVRAPVSRASACSSMSTRPGTVTRARRTG